MVCQAITSLTRSQIKWGSYALGALSGCATYAYPSVVLGCTTAAFLAIGEIARRSGKPTIAATSQSTPRAPMTKVAASATSRSESTDLQDNLAEARNGLNIIFCMLADAEADLPKIVQVYVIVKDKVVQLGKKEQFAQERRQLLLLKNALEALRDQQTPSAEFTHFQQICALEKDVEKESLSQTELPALKSRFTQLLQNSRNPNFLFKELMAFKLKEIQGILNPKKASEGFPTRMAPLTLPSAPLSQKTQTVATATISQLPSPPQRTQTVAPLSLSQSGVPAPKKPESAKAVSNPTPPGPRKLLFTLNGALPAESAKIAKECPKPKPTDFIFPSTPQYAISCDRHNDPGFEDGNKQGVYEILTGGKLYRPKGPIFFHKMRLNREEANKLKFKIGGQIKMLPGQMPHAPSSGKTKVFTSNFADENLFFGCMGGLFAQDEIQGTVHSGIPHVRRTLTALGEFEGQRVDHLGRDEVAVVQNIEMLGRFTDFNGIYGNDFERAPFDLIQSKLQKLETPTQSNIIAFLAPDLRGKVKTNDFYSKAHLEAFFYQALAACHAMKGCVQPGTGTRIIWETGLSGTGAFGNGVNASVILQLAAAKFAGIDEVQLFPFNRSGEAETAKEYFDGMLKEISKMTVNQFVEFITKDENIKRFNLRYGRPDGN